MVKQRTDIMVNLMKIIKPNSSQIQQSEAYFVGILSLMDTLMHLPLPDILNEFYVDKRVVDALFNQSGFLGELYSVALAVENFETDLITDFLNKYKRSRAEFEKMILEVFKMTVAMKKDSD